MATHAKTNNEIIQLQVFVGLAIIGLNFFLYDWFEAIRYYALAASILIIGMPHGALDHKIYFKALHKEETLKTQIIFYSGYLLVVAVYAWLWYVQPFIGFVLFMLFTLYHFGQSDTERLPLNGFLKQLFIVARGLSIAGLILFGSDPFYTSRVVESVTGMSLISIVYNFTTTEDLRLFFVVMYPSVYLLGSLLSKKVPLKSWLSLDALVVPALFSLVDPIFAFALYFGLWHGYNHTKTMLDFLSSKDEQIGFGWFYKETALFSAISYIGLILIYFLVQAFGDEALLVAILFTLISVITLPHMLVVEQMYRAFDKADGDQST